MGVDPALPSTITAFPPGYIDKDKEVGAGPLAAQPASWVLPFHLAAWELGAAPSGLSPTPCWRIFYRSTQQRANNGRVAHVFVVAAADRFPGRLRGPACNPGVDSLCLALPGTSAHRLWWASRPTSR